MCVYMLRGGISHTVIKRRPSSHPTRSLATRLSECQVGLSEPYCAAVNTLVDSGSQRPWLKPVRPKATVLPGTAKRQSVVQGRANTDRQLLPSRRQLDRCAAGPRDKISPRMSISYNDIIPSNKDITTSYNSCARS